MADESRQEEELRELEQTVAGIEEGSVPRGDAQAAFGARLRSLWAELDGGVGAFSDNRFACTQLLKAVGNLLAGRPDEERKEMAGELFALGADKVFGVILRLCGKEGEPGAAERSSDLRHHASVMLYRLVPMKEGIEWVAANPGQVDVISAMFGDDAQPGAIREHAAAVLLSFSRVKELQGRLATPETLDAIMRALDSGADAGSGAVDYHRTLRRYAGTIMGDISALPSLHEWIEADPHPFMSTVINMLAGSDAADAAQNSRIAGSILSNVSSAAPLQRSIIEVGGLEPLIAAVGDPLHPADAKLQLMALFTLANVSSCKENWADMLSDNQAFNSSQALSQRSMSPPNTAGSRASSVSFDDEALRSPPGTAQTPALLRMLLPLMAEDEKPQTQRQRYAVAILTRLGRAPWNQETIGRHTSILRRLLQMLGRAEAEPGAARLAGSCLSVLSVHPRNQLRFSKIQLPMESMDEDEEEERARCAVAVLLKLLRDGVEPSLSRCAACTLTNMAACVEAHEEMFKHPTITTSLFGLLQRQDSTLQRYGCDAISNLALGSHRRPPTRQGTPGGTEASQPEDGEFTVTFDDASQCASLCGLLPMEDGEGAEGEVDSMTLQDHVVSALCCLGRRRANQQFLRSEPKLLYRLGRYVCSALELYTEFAETSDRPGDFDEQPMTFALRLIGALSPAAETADDEVSVADALIRCVSHGPRRVATMSMSALRRLCGNPEVRLSCAQSEGLLSDLSRHLDSKIRHALHEESNRAVRKAAADLLFALTTLPASVALIATTQSDEYLSGPRPLGDVVGSCLAVAERTPEDVVELRAAVLGVLFNAAAAQETAERLAEDSSLMPIVTKLTGAARDKGDGEDADTHAEAAVCKLQQYAVGLLSQVAVFESCVPRLVEAATTMSPTGLVELTGALGRQLRSAAACLTDTADERWQFTQSTHSSARSRAGCYAAAALSKLTANAQIRAATMVHVEGEVSLPDFDEAAKRAKRATEAREANGDKSSTVARDEAEVNEENKKVAEASHGALDKDWWTETKSYECPIAELMLRVLEDEEAMGTLELGNSAAITLWHLTACTDDDQRARRTIGASTRCWLSLTACLKRPGTSEVRKRPDHRKHIISALWNLLRVEPFQAKARHTAGLFAALTNIADGLQRNDPEIAYGDSIPQLRERLAGLLTQMVLSDSNAELLAADKKLHDVLIEWLDIEEMEAAEVAKAAAEAAAEAESLERAAAEEEAAKKKGLKERIAAKGKAKAKAAEAAEAALAQAAENERLRCEELEDFASRTVVVKGIGKQWLEESALARRFGEYGQVVACVVRLKLHDENETGEPFQSWALVAFADPSAVSRVFAHPDNENVTLEMQKVRADPEEPEDGEGEEAPVVFRITKVDSVS